MSVRCLCCANTYDLGCLIACGNIELPMSAPDPGEYRLELEFNGTVHAFTQVVEDTSPYSPVPFVIPAGRYNENFQHVFRAFDSEGNQIIYNFADVEYDCTSFRTNPSVISESISVQGTIHQPIQE